MRKFIVETGNIYHVFNRGVEKRRIFINKNDYERFLVNIVIFNTVSESKANVSRYNLQEACQKIPTKPLVKIHCFSLMPNHFHFMLEQVAENGIARFMHRVEMGYSRYFNTFYERSGHLFQGAYRIVSVDKDKYSLYLSLYIHLNPLELLQPEKDWKERGITNKKDALDFLTNYRWSSLQTYLGEKSFPFVEKSLINEFYENPRQWKDEIKSWLPSKTEMFSD